MLNSPITERTTAATDAILGVVSVALVPSLLAARAHDPWRTWLWASLFVLVAAASFLGAVVHGFALRPALRDALWQPLFLVLGIVVALFVVGAARDWIGEAGARRLLLPAIAVGALFWVASRVLGGDFRVFVVYEGAAMAASLAIYLALAFNGTTPGAATMAAAIALNLVAAGLQASSVQVNVVWPFDHNSVFHLVQIVAVVLLQRGVLAGLVAPASLVSGC